MAVNFNLVSPSVRASQIFIELQGVRRSVSGTLLPPIGLIVGQYLAAKASGITDYVPVKVTSADEVGEIAGFGSEAHRQAMWIFGILGGFYSNMYYAPVPAPGGGVAASGDIVFTTNASSGGTHEFLIGGDLIRINVASGDTPTEQGDALDAAITANLGGSVTASNSAGTVTLTAKNTGVNGNQIRIIYNPNERTDVPGGTTVTVPGSGGYLTSGSGDTDTEDVFFETDGSDKLGDRFYTHISGPYVDTTNLGFYGDSFDLRVQPQIKRPFDAFIGYIKETYSAVISAVEAINNRGITAIWDNRCYAPNWEMQAAIMGLAMWSCVFDPGRPFKTLQTGLPFDVDTGDLNYAKNDALFIAGVSYLVTINDGLAIGDLATTYRTNGVGAATEEWFDSVSIHRRQQKIYDLETLFKNEPYSRGMIADNDSITAKPYVIKPKKVIADLSALVDNWASEGWTKNAAEVKASIAAEINATNNSRIDAEVTDDEAQALRIIAIAYKFLF
jgi:phage tail sheath gpL-like